MSDHEEVETETDHENPSDCKIVEKLVLAHRWAHRSMDLLTILQLGEAHGLAIELLKYLDDCNKPNGVKLLALIEALGVGADELEYREALVLRGTEIPKGTVN